MKKLLIYLLLLANFCSGLAFALDTHSEAMVGHDVEIVDLASGSDHNHPGDLHHDDHSCHGVAHLTGVFTSTTALVVLAERDYRSSLVVALPSLYITPLLRPPII